MRHQINLQQIEYFLAVARHLNFTGAAKTLYLSQPALSKQIAVFENEIGVQLFFRTRRSVRLTPAGAVLYHELGAITNQIDKALEKAGVPSLGENGTLAVGFLDAMGTSFLPERVQEFRRDHPGIQLVFERHSFKALREKFIRGDLDIIFTLSFEIDETADINWDSVFLTQSCIVVSASHPLADRARVQIEDLAGEDIIMISRDESPRAYEANLAVLRKHGVVPRNARQLPNAESVLFSIESGMGAGLLDANIRMIYSDAFKTFPVEGELIDVGMAYKKSNLNPAVALFASRFRDKNRS